MHRKRCFREPISQIYDSYRYLDAAVSAHLNGKFCIADELFRLADLPEVRDWTESIWGKSSPYVIVKKMPEVHVSPKVKARMPDAQMKQKVIARDGCHCRFCGIPVIRSEVRKFIHNLYPESVPWGRTNLSQHSAFQCMWLQFDHVVPHSAGGENTLENLVVTCAACNFGKMEYTLDELGLDDPRLRPVLMSCRDGLERVVG